MPIISFRNQSAGAFYGTSKSIESTPLSRPHSESRRKAVSRHFIRSTSEESRNESPLSNSHSVRTSSPTVNSDPLTSGRIGVSPSVVFTEEDFDSSPVIEQIDHRNSAESEVGVDAADIEDTSSTNSGECLIV